MDPSETMGQGPSEGHPEASGEGPGLGEAVESIACHPAEEQACDKRQVGG